MKNDFAHGDGHESVHPGVPVSFNGPCHIDVAQDNAAKNCAC